MAETKKTTKPAVKKTAAKTATKKAASKTVKPAVKKETAVKKPVAPAKTTVESRAQVKAAPQTGSLKVEVLDAKGAVAEMLSLPAEIFGVKVNKQLIAQAVRVYLANQRVGSASTKTRGEVQGSTRKIYRQKGTGRARHGGVRAPIFVHGGIAHGPQPKDWSMSMPKKMKRAALFSALTAKLQDNGVKVVSGLEKLEPKTKVMAHVLEKLSLPGDSRKVLVIVPDSAHTVTRAVRNLEGITYTAAKRLNTYEVVNTKVVLFLKDSLAELESTFLPKE